MFVVYRTLLEHLLVAGLLMELDDQGELAKHQYGIRKRRSTADIIKQVINLIGYFKSRASQQKDLCLLIYLNIKNALNSLLKSGMD